MSPMHIQISRIAPTLLSQRREELLHDASLPLTVRGCINVHAEKSWIPNFWAVAIRAAKPGSESIPSPTRDQSTRPPTRDQSTRPPTRDQSTRPPTRDQSFFDFPIGYADDSTLWYFPSRQWWIAHANVSHPPSGEGCDVDVHTKFLSREGSVYEFDYATILTDGTLHILRRSDFVVECDFWQRAFGARVAAP
jgi:hypothetical protein